MTISFAARPLATAVVLLAVWVTSACALAQPAALAQATAQVGAAVDERAPQFDVALVEYEHNRWAQDSAALLALGDRGHSVACQPAARGPRAACDRLRLAAVGTGSDGQNPQTIHQRHTMP